MKSFAACLPLMAAVGMASPLRSLVPRQGELGPLNEDWLNVPCDTPSFTDSANDPEQQWNDAGSVAAWAHMVTQWRNYSSNDNSNPNDMPNSHQIEGLTDWAFNYFHARPASNCADVTSTSCDTTMLCDDPDAPAAYIILNSIVALHNQFHNLYDSIFNAHDLIQDNVGALTETFSGSLNNLAAEKHKVDGILLAFQVVSALSFNSWFRKLPYFKNNPNNLGVLKDTVNAAVGTGWATWVKDGLESATLGEQNELSSYLGEVVTAWANGVATWNEGLFNDVDSETGVDVLRLITLGQSFAETLPDNPMDTVGVMERLLYANLIPYLWYAGPSGGVPVVVTSEGFAVRDPLDHDYEKGGIGCMNLHFGGAMDGENIADWTVFKDACWGLEGPDESFTLAWVSASRQARNCRDCGDYIETKYDKVPGLGALDINAMVFRGLNYQDLIKSAVRTWKSNGEQNGWDTPEFDIVNADMDAMGPETGALPLGMVQLPVCSMAEIRENTLKDYDNSGQNPYWPCNPVE